MKVLAADIGFSSTGLAILSLEGSKWNLFDTRCIHTEQGHTKKKILGGKKRKISLTSVAKDDIRRIEYMASEIFNYFLENKCEFLVCEIPHSGSQNAKAAKGMGAATAMIAVIRLILRCPAIWITPHESRAAAGWREDFLKGVPAKDKKKVVKNFVMKAMSEKYPMISDIDPDDKEHIADALSAFEAAKTKPSFIEYETHR